MRTYLFQLCGVDLTRIDGIDVTTAFKVLAEVGVDLSRFKSAKHFASWLGLCSGTKISDGKVLSGVAKRTTNRAAQALRMVAANLRTSQSALGAYYRRLCARRQTSPAPSPPVLINWPASSTAWLPKAKNTSIKARPNTRNATVSGSSSR